MGHLQIKVPLRGFCRGSQHSGALVGGMGCRAENVRVVMPTSTVELNG
jgi:hypothetical protein